MKPLQVPENRRMSWKRLIEKSGTFFAILIFNVSTLLILSGMVIIPRIIQSIEETPRGFAIKPPPPAIKPPAKMGGKGADNHLDPSALVHPPPMAATSIVASINPTISSSFAFTTPSTSLISTPSLLPPVGRNETKTHAAQSVMDLGNSLFGVSDSQGTPMFTGLLYDFKQTADHQPTGYDPLAYHKALRDFVAADWSQEMLSKYYQFSKTLFTPQIYIPQIQAVLGPQQFGAENEVKPRMWIAYYKATVVPAEDGEYQFYGTCDDIILVRVQGKTVLDGSLNNVAGLKEKAFKFDLLDVGPKRHVWGSLVQGIPFRVSAGVPINLDVIIGEQPGGWFDAFLLLGKVGIQYETGPNGMPKIPVFQVAPATIPTATGNPRLDAGPPIVWPAQADTQ